MGKKVLKDKHLENTESNLYMSKNYFHLKCYVGNFKNCFA